MYRKKIILVIAAFFLISTTLTAQWQKVSGYISDATSEEKLIGATVLDHASGNAIATNEYGFFSLKVKESFVCRVSHVGYSTTVIAGKAVADTLLHIKLTQGVELDEIVVGAQRGQRQEHSLSAMKLNPEMMKNIPVVFGERDVLKVIQLQPGVQPAREGSTGFSVRGGSNDQNLFLLDGIPVYNVNHLFGFFSVFSPQAINNCTFLKGGIPARYGGRLSSITDLRLKEGNNEKLHGHITAGLIASGASLEGPLLKNKSTFMVTARRTYLDVFSRPISTLVNNESIGYYFQDFTLKTNYTFNENNKLYLSFYGGNDKALMNYKDKDTNDTYTSNFGLGWGNIISALRWNSIWGKSLFSNTTLYYSQYRYRTSSLDKQFHTPTDSLISKRYNAFSSNVRDWGLKWDLDIYATNTLKFKTGLEGIAHRYRPGVSNLVDFDESNDIDHQMGTVIDNVELSGYAEADYNPGARLNLNVGLRATQAFYPGAPLPILQPRAQARYHATNKLTLMGSVNLHAQYVHLVSNSNISAPSDLWLPVMSGIPPQKALQYTLGGNYQFKPGINLSVEAYHKNFDNLLEFKPDEIINHTVSNWADVTLLGTGKAKGIELMLEKTTGKTTGWIGYTLSKSDRTFEGINDGKTFPFKYDRTHNVSVMVSHQFSKTKQLTAVWVYTSGFYITLHYDSYMMNTPNGGYMEFNNYKERNNWRTPAYHRLDLAYSVKKQKKRGIREWSYGLYNTYSRINPYSFYYNEVKENEGDYQSDIIGRKLHMYGLFPIVPSVSYTFTF